MYQDTTPLPEIDPAAPAEERQSAMRRWLAGACREHLRSSPKALLAVQVALAGGGRSIGALSPRIAAVIAPRVTPDTRPNYANRNKEIMTCAAAL